MPEYLVKIKGIAFKKRTGFSFGLDVPYNVKEERTFFVDNDAEAYKAAKNSLTEISDRLSSPKLSIDSIMEIRPFDLSTYAL
ncbi:MAG TPA: hypothetical protein VJ208_04035 [Candidatus Nanoarchaeia archaeon]|nr:hypothetical protein [Candidatus Nanoarchaeia archaeon]